LGAALRAAGLRLTVRRGVAADDGATGEPGRSVAGWAAGAGVGAGAGSIGSGSIQPEPVQPISI
jgi:hypothetical protein